MRSRHSGLVELLGLDELEPERPRRVGDRRRLERAAAPARAVRAARSTSAGPVRAPGEPLEHGGGEAEVPR